MFKLTAPLHRVFTTPHEEALRPVVLPDSIRYALQYDHGQLLPADVLTLTQPEHQDGALYLTLKLLHGSPEAQRQLLTGLLKGESPRALTEQGLSRVAPGQKVDGRKLAQLSRQGFPLWDACYRKEARLSLQAAPDQPRGRLALVAYATTVGLRAFLEELRPQGRPFFLVVPRWLEDSMQPLAAFRIETRAGAPEVALCSKQELVRTPLTLLDDTVHTGRSRDALLRFWADGFEGSRPEFRTLDLAPTPF